jgi:hypothetical protein
MFIVAQRGIGLKKGFFFWGFIALCGAVGLTMHVHYEPEPHEPLHKSKNRPEDEGWYISVGEKQVGPTQFDDLVRLARRGLLSPDMQVWCPGESRWKRAEDVPGLFALPKHGSPSKDAG